MANCGDFNLIRSPANRNNPGGSIQEMLKFNEAISKLRINEAPLKDCKFTWTNKRMNPLLERLDWFFSSKRPRKTVKLGGLLHPYPVNISPKDLGLKINES